MPQRLARALVIACCSFLLVGAGGCKKHKKKKGAAAQEAADTTPAQKHPVQEYVEIEVDSDGFHPDKIYANRGQPITLIFKRTSDKTCATAVVIADEGVRKELPLDTQVKVPIIPGKTGAEHFACPMNMYGGDIVVQ